MRVCPDYVFVPQGQRRGVRAAARHRELDARFGSIVANPDYCSCVGEANFDHVLDLLDDAAASGASGTR